MNDLTDNQLITIYREGNTQALDILIGRYVVPLYNFIAHYTKNQSEAHDLTQETFLKVWKYLKKFDQQKSFKTWLYTIARNTSLDWLRKKKPVSFSSQEITEETIAHHLDQDEKLPEEIFDNGLLYQSVLKIVETLNPEYQTVLYLHNDEEFTFQEIAEILEEPLDTVKSRYRRALLAIKKDMKKEMHQKA